MVPIAPVLPASCKALIGRLLTNALAAFFWAGVAAMMPFPNGACTAGGGARPANTFVEFTPVWPVPLQLMPLLTIPGDPTPNSPRGAGAATEPEAQRTAEMMKKELIKCILWLSVPKLKDCMGSISDLRRSSSIRIRRGNLLLRRTDGW